MVYRQQYEGSMSPNQREAKQRSIEEQLERAKALPTPPKPRTVEDYIPILKVLRDEKGMSWTLIQDWMRDNTEFNRSATFWTNLYKGKKIGIQTIVTPTAAGDQSPNVTL